MLRMLILFASSVEKDVAKAYIQIGINTNTLPSQNWVTGNDSPGSLRELLALVSTGDAPQDYSETLYGGRNTACNVLTRSSC
jgi:hypothetical protein